ncbi:hypothetical protein, partial [Elstera cyanobacteriorum]|nr:hypothetical protein [Elstera cyanobacteriorum]
MAAKGQTLKEFGNLYPAESKLLAACRDGTVAEINVSRPERMKEENRVRAAFVRFLALGVGVSIHERGLRLVGAAIDGGFDLENCTIPYSIIIFNCLFGVDDKNLNSLNFRYSVFEGIVLLSGSLISS